MDFEATVKVNKKIMGLIRSKYTDINDVPSSGPDYIYYKHLERDVEKVERYNSFSDKKDPTNES